MSGPIVRCGSCSGDELETVLHLGWSAPSCSMQSVDKPHQAQVVYPLELKRCQNSYCGLVQLGYVVSRQEVFHEDYPYSSGNSPELRNNFAELAEASEPYLSSGDLIVDIGANDGTLLNAFIGDFRRLAVDPTNQVHKGGCEAVAEFFGFGLAMRLREQHGAAKLITACNVLAHVESLHDVLNGVEHLLADDGTFVVENHDLASVANGQWDTVYHEHLSFFSVRSFTYALAQHGLVPTHVERIRTHGGSFRVFAKRAGSSGSYTAPLEAAHDWEALQMEASRHRNYLRGYLGSQKAGGKRVVGIGATARASTIIGYCGFSAEDIRCVYEVSGSDKIGHYMAGTDIPVKSEDDGLFGPFPPENAILFSWHLADKIIPKLRMRGYWGSIIVPLPEPRIDRFRSDRAAGI